MKINGTEDSLISWLADPNASPLGINPGTGPKKVVYECDPGRNTMCEKKECFYSGGECHWTTRKAFAVEWAKAIEV